MYLHAGTFHFTNLCHYLGMIRFYSFLFLIGLNASSAELQTNSTNSVDAPKWLTKNRVDKVADRIGNYLEWEVRRVKMVWYTDQSKFESAHGLGTSALAVSRKSDKTILMGPKVTDENFDQIFGHELVHVVSYQKFKDGIPQWLEEGLANFVAKNGAVDYKWLKKKTPPADVRSLTHPFGGDADNTRYHYIASQALAEMISAKCDLKVLLRLSIGRKMDDYLVTYCNIKDLNADFKKWISSK